MCAVPIFMTESLLFSVGSKCLTLLVEIHPVNNVKVLKAVDSCVWVQVGKSVVSLIPRCDAEAERGWCTQYFHTHYHL